MRTTPRGMRASRGIGTLIGNGWLREQPRVASGWGRWDARSKSALRKCMFMVVPDALRQRMPEPDPSPPLPPRPMARLPEPEIHAHRRDPRKDVRQFPAYYAGAPAPLDPRVAAQQAYALHMQNAQKLAADAARKGPQAWWEDPIAMGSLLILLPPVGLAAVWSSKRYSTDARWALTVMTGLTMCLMTAVTIAILMMH